MNIERNRFVELDSIRGIAALAVIVYHYLYRYNELYLHEGFNFDWAYWGKYGVQLFFIISGFVIYMSLVRVNSPVDFIASRFTRLFPAYWVAIFITTSFVFYFGLPGRELSIVSTLINFTMLQGFLNVGHVDGVYWTLTIELIFYFWMFVLLILNRINHIAYLMFALLFFSIFYKSGFIPENKYLEKIFLIEYISYFSIGVMFFKLYQDGIRFFNMIVLSMSVFLIYISNDIYVFCLSLILMSTVYISIFHSIKIFKMRIFIFFGSISYSLYLLHQNVGYVIINIGYEIGFHPFLSMAIAFFTSIVLSTILTYYIEKPVMKLMRNFYRRHRDSLIMNSNL